MADDVRAALRALPHFEGVDDATLDRLAAGSRVTVHARGGLVFREGEPPRALCAVLSGGVRLVRTTPDGRLQVLHRLGPGQSFAEAAVLNMASYPATAEATVDGTRVLEVGSATFLLLFDTDRRLPRAMVASLSNWLRRLVLRVEELTVTSASARLARHLLDLPSRPVDGGVEVRLPVTKREVAERLGITPETLSRTLRRWADDGLLRSERDRLVLLDVARLVAEAGEAGWTG